METESKFLLEFNLNGFSEEKLYQILQLENNFDCRNLRVLKEYLVEVARLHPTLPDVDEGFLPRHDNYSKFLRSLINSKRRTSTNNYYKTSGRSPEIF